jgi:hypothetical protein
MPSLSTIRFSSTFLTAKQSGEDFSQKLNEKFEITSSAVIPSISGNFSYAC